MRIGVLSDTHIPESGPELFPEILDALRGVDLIMHAGDLVVPRVLDELEAIAPVLAAQGNHDPELPSDPRLELLHIVEFEGHSVALLHTFEPLHSGLDTLVRHYLGGVRTDVVVYGDSHYERIDYLDGALLLNPGSAMLPRNMSSRLGHIAFLTLEAGRAPQAEIVDLATASASDYA